MSLPESSGFKASTTECHSEFWDNVWTFTDIVILITGVLTNAPLLWLFLQERKSLSASQVLGLNLVVINLLYLSIMPVSLIYTSFEMDHKVNRSDIAMEDNDAIDPMELSRDIFSMFNLIGCPLLLTCMCIERYMAVVTPVLYMRMRKWEHRMAVCAVVWFVTLAFCLGTGILNDIISIMVYVSIIISCLFILMLACLGGVVWSLKQQSPAYTTHGSQARSKSPQKRRAVFNVLVVVVPAVMSYLPSLMMFPIVLYIYYSTKCVPYYVCSILYLSSIFPRYGVLIGPLFYLSRAREMWCLSGTGKKSNE